MYNLVLDENCLEGSNKFICRKLVHGTAAGSETVRTRVPCCKGQLEIRTLTWSKSMVLSPLTVLHCYRRDLKFFCTVTHNNQSGRRLLWKLNINMVKYGWIITYFLTLQCSGKGMRQKQFYSVFFLTTYKKNYQPPHHLLWYCKDVHIWAPFEFAKLLWTKGSVALEHRWEADRIW